MAVASTQTEERDDLASRTIPRAVPIATAALGLGLLAQLLFFDVGIGINVPIAVAALLLAAWITSAPNPRRLRLPDAWLPAAALFFASFAAIRGDRTLVAMDVLASLALGAASIASFGDMAVVTRPLIGVVVQAGRLLASIASGAATVLPAALRQASWTWMRRRGGSWGAVVRGLLLAVPMLLLFVALFSAADAVFATWTERVLDWDLDLSGVGGRVVIALVAAWLAAGLLAFAVRPGGETAELALHRAWSRRWRIGTIEAVVVLGALNTVFLAFVVLQAAYLFGGRDTLAETGLTYAEYARSGFFELLAVALLVAILMLGAEAFVRSRPLAYRALLIGLVLMTLVVLASAFLRLRLYQDAFGWTELRFYVLAAILWLAIGAVMAVATIARNLTGWLVHGLLGLSILFGIVFNVVGPVRYVAEQNVNRARAEVDATGSLRFDIEYAATLGSDAVSEALRAFADLPLPPSVHERIEEELAEASGLNDPRNSAWQAWNFSRERARELLGR